MPTYDFTCPEGHEFEKFFRSIASSPMELPCPVCGKPAVRQVSGGAGLVFKGSGFYITDYGKDGKKDLKPAKPAAKGSDSKPAESGASEPKATEPKAPVSKPADSGSAASSSTKSSE